MSGRPSRDAGACDAFDARPFRLFAYVLDRWPQCAIAAFCAAGVFVSSLVQGASAQGAALAALLVATCAAAAFAVDFCRKRRFYREMSEVALAADDACAFGSLIEEPGFLEGEEAHAAMCALSRAAARQVDAAERDARDYRGYIDAWIHEIKTPMAASRLVLARMHGPEADRLARELERIELQVESALFYARSSFLEGDYAIGELGLADACREACKRNSRFLIESGCIPRIDVPDGDTVLSDRQWVVFMLVQLVVNSAKYGASHVVFSSSVENAGSSGECTVLEVADDGPGIPEEDVPRVFDMGFTGRNGRAAGHATGLGLYLVARLAEAMGLGVAIASEEGRGTRVMLTFPHDRRRAEALSGDLSRM